jgi:ribonuclease D
LSESYQLISDPRALEAALADLRGPVAVDTEFHAEYRYRPQLMLIQLRGAGGRSLVVDALAIEDLSPLGEALSGVELYVHAAASDIPLLVRCAGLRPGRVLDTQVIAGLAGLGYPAGLSGLLETVLGVHSGTSMGLSDWSRRPLDPTQLRYAVGDVAYLHALSHALLERLDERRRDMIEGATAEQIEAALSPPRPERAWRRIPAAEVLDGRGREILRLLAEWRERLAAKTDRPVYQIASNAVLIDVARRKPMSRAELLSNRKMPRGVVKHHGEHLLGAVEAAMAAPGSALPPAVSVTPERRALDALLLAWAAGVEAREGVAARLLLPSSLRASLLDSASRREAPGPLLGWRRAWEAPLSALLEGRAAIRMTEGSTALENRD